MKLEWSGTALADLDRFEEFLQRDYPHLALKVIKSITNAARVLEEHPKLGRPLAGRDEYRQVVLRVLKAGYIFNTVMTANGW